MAASFDGSEVISIVGPLLMILMLLGGVVLVARRFRRGVSIGRLAGAPAIKIVAARSVGWHSSILIIEAEGQRYLAASGRAGVSLLGALGRVSAANFESFIATSDGPGD